MLVLLHVPDNDDLPRVHSVTCMQATQLCEYLAQLSLVDFSMLRFKTSIIAAAVLHVALAALDREDAYPVAVARHSGYSIDEVRDSCGASVLHLPFVLQFAGNQATRHELNAAITLCGRALPTHLSHGLIPTILL